MQNPNYIPYTVYNSVTGEPITIYGRTAEAQGRPTSNLDTYDPERERIYDSYGVDFRARLGAGAQVFGGFGFERQLEVACTAPDDPNTLRFCDDRQNDIPFRSQFKLCRVVSDEVGDHVVSGSFQSVQGNTSLRGVTTAHDARVGRSRHDGDHARHDAVSGELPGAVPGRGGHSAGDVPAGDVSLCISRIRTRRTRTGSTNWISRSRRRSGSAG